MGVPAGPAFTGHGASWCHGARANEGELCSAFMRVLKWLTGSCGLRFLLNLHIFRRVLLSHRE